MIGISNLTYHCLFLQRRSFHFLRKTFCPEKNFLLFGDNLFCLWGDNLLVLLWDNQFSFYLERMSFSWERKSFSYEKILFRKAFCFVKREIFSDISKLFFLRWNRLWNKWAQKAEAEFSIGWAWLNLA